MTYRKEAAVMLSGPKQQIPFLKPTEMSVCMCVSKRVRMHVCVWWEGVCVRGAVDQGCDTSEVAVLIVASPTSTPPHTHKHTYTHTIYTCTHTHTHTHTQPWDDRNQM